MATGGTTSKNLPRELKLEFIKKITDDFSQQQLIGTGTFGSVYKGTLDSGEIIAVKKLAENSPVPRDQIFANEVQNIMVLEHENIVKMVAYCREAQNRLVQMDGSSVGITETLLCYEYLPMGSLDKQLFGMPYKSLTDLCCIYFLCFFIFTWFGIFTWLAMHKFHQFHQYSSDKEK